MPSPKKSQGATGAETASRYAKEFKFDLTPEAKAVFEKLTADDVEALWSCLHDIRQAGMDDCPWCAPGGVENIPDKYR